LLRELGLVVRGSAGSGCAGVEVDAVLAAEALDRSAEEGHEVAEGGELVEGGDAVEELVSGDGGAEVAAGHG
jgi:hypothetical protein